MHSPRGSLEVEDGGMCGRAKRLSSWKITGMEEFGTVENEGMGQRMYCTSPEGHIKLSDGTFHNTAWDKTFVSQ